MPRYGCRDWALAFLAATVLVGLMCCCGKVWG